MKKGFIQVIDRHFTGDKEGESGELKTSCLIGAEDGAIVIKYHETVDMPEDCETNLRIEKDRITMMRHGRFRTSMMFENGKRHTCCYETPFGEIMIGIYTNAMFIDFDEDGGIIDFAYTIDSAGDLLSENELKIIVDTEEEDYVSFG